MKKIITFVLMSVFILSCSNDDNPVFNVDPSEVEITFEPTSGGAIMRYVLPDNSDIHLIQASYNDHYGEKINIKGSYANNELELVGFINQEDSIPVDITLINRGSISSSSITKYFSTEQAGALSFFENLTVNSYWSGFQVQYDITEDVDGFVNIGYVGINPVTEELDTILVNTTPITMGANNYYYANINDPEIDDVEVVIWTDDYRGNRVKKEVYESIEVAKANKLDLQSTAFSGPSTEDTYQELSSEYLFDGDTKGVTGFTEQHFARNYCFRSPSRSIPGEWVLDLGDSQTVAYVRLYSYLLYNWFLYNRVDPAVGPYSRYGCPQQIPSNVVVYGSNDPNLPTDQWDRLGEYYEPSTSLYENRWCWRSMDIAELYDEIEDLEAADPVFMQISFDITGETYRYLKLEVLETFVTFDFRGNPRTPSQRFYAEELEVYTQSVD